MGCTKVIGLLIGGVLFGCQSSSTQSKVDDTDKPVDIAPKILVKNCGGISPIRDRTKLIDNLRISGVITADMDQQQIDKVVSEYIAKRQKAFQECHKPKSKPGK